MTAPLFANGGDVNELPKTSAYEALHRAKSMRRD